MNNAKFTLIACSLLLFLTLVSYYFLGSWRNQYINNHYHQVLKLAASGNTEQLYTASTKLLDELQVAIAKNGKYNLGYWIITGDLMVLNGRYRQAQNIFLGAKQLNANDSTIDDRISLVNNLLAAKATANIILKLDVNIDSAATYLQALPLTTTVFIIIKNLHSNIPIAVKKLTLAALQSTIVITDDDRMLSDSNFSNDTYQVAVRISQSGIAKQQAEDIEVLKTMQLPSTEIHKIELKIKN